MNDAPKPGDKVRVTYETIVHSDGFIKGFDDARYYDEYAQYEVIERAKPVYPIGTVFETNTGIALVKTGERVYDGFEGGRRDPGYGIGVEDPANEDLFEHVGTIDGLIKLRQRLEEWHTATGKKCYADVETEAFTRWDEIGEILEETK